MSNDFWDTRYREPGYAYGTEPNAFLASKASLLTPGMTALAVADGEGRNGVWLASRGLDVLSVDASDVGLRKTRELAASRGVAIRTAQADLGRWPWPRGVFDVVVSVFAHFPPELRVRVHHAMLAALKPGGLVILEAFSPEQINYASGGPRVAEMLYSAATLRADFATAEVLELTETRTELAEGRYHSGPAAVVRLVVRRP